MSTLPPSFPLLRPNYAYAAEGRINDQIGSSLRAKRDKPKRDPKSRDNACDRGDMAILLSGGL